ncbi:MAG TPA: hypothetical protein VLA79_08395 [Polyangia bacterium]|nr:hypothetical protein [Polyangia bacterium]
MPAQYQANIDPQLPLDGRAAGSQPPMSEQELVDLEAFLDTLTDADMVNLLNPPPAVPALGTNGSAMRTLVLMLLAGGLVGFGWRGTRRRTGHAPSSPSSTRSRRA